MSLSLPEPLRELVRNLYPGFLDYYLSTCDANKHIDGQVSYEHACNYFLLVVVGGYQLRSFVDVIAAHDGSV
jgi:hypothetical protein